MFEAGVPYGVGFMFGTWFGMWLVVYCMKIERGVLVTKWPWR